MRKIFLILVLSFSIKTFSCSCYTSMHPSSLKRINSATEVFEGKVISQKYSDKNQMIIYRLKVIKAYKGVSEFDVIEITSMKTAASCRQFFEENTNWLVFAFDGFTSRCSGNILINEVNSKRIKQRFSNIKKSNVAKGELLVEELDDKKRVLAKGKQDFYGNPIGEWKYYSFKSECAQKDTYNYNSNGCLEDKSSTRTCN